MRTTAPSIWEVKAKVHERINRARDERRALFQRHMLVRDRREQVARICAQIEAWEQVLEDIEYLTDNV